MSQQLFNACLPSVGPSPTTTTFINPNESRREFVKRKYPERLKLYDSLGLETERGTRRVKKEHAYTDEQAQFNETIRRAYRRYVQGLGIAPTPTAELASERGAVNLLITMSRNNSNDDADAMDIDDPPPRPPSPVIVLDDDDAFSEAALEEVTTSAPLFKQQKVAKAVLDQYRDLPSSIQQYTRAALHMPPEENTPETKAYAKFRYLLMYDSSPAELAEEMHSGAFDLLHLPNAWELGRNTFASTAVALSWFRALDEQIRSLSSQVDQVAVYQAYFTGLFEQDLSWARFEELLAVLVPAHSHLNDEECVHGFLQALAKSQAHTLRRDAKVAPRIAWGIVNHVMTTRVSTYLPELDYWFDLLSHFLSDAALNPRQPYIFFALCEAILGLYRLHGREDLNDLVQRINDILNARNNTEYLDILTSLTSPPQQQQQSPAAADNTLVEELAVLAVPLPAVLKAAEKEHHTKKKKPWDSEAAQVLVSLAENTQRHDRVLYLVDTLQGSHEDELQPLLEAAIQSLELNLVAAVLVMGTDQWAQVPALEFGLFHDWLALYDFEHFTDLPQDVYGRMADMLDACLRFHVPLAHGLLPFLVGSAAAFERYTSTYDMKALPVYMDSVTQHGVAFRRLFFDGATKLSYAHLLPVINSLRTTLQYKLTPGDYAAIAEQYWNWDRYHAHPVREVHASVEDLAALAVVMVSLEETALYAPLFSADVKELKEWSLVPGHFERFTLGMELRVSFYASKEQLSDAFADPPPEKLASEVDLTRMDKDTPLYLFRESVGIMVITDMFIPLWFQGYGTATKLLRNAMQQVTRHSDTGALGFVMIHWAHVSMKYLTDRYHGWRSFYGAFEKDQSDYAFSRGRFNFFDRYTIKAGGVRTHVQEAAKHVINEHLVWAVPLMRFAVAIETSLKRGVRLHEGLEASAKSIAEQLNLLVAKGRRVKETLVAEHISVTVVLRHFKAKGDAERIATKRDLIWLGNVDKSVLRLELRDFTFRSEVLPEENKRHILLALVQLTVNLCRVWARPLSLRGPLFLSMVNDALWTDYGDPHEQPWPSFTQRREGYNWIPSARPRTFIRHDAAVEHLPLAQRIIMQDELDSDPETNGKVRWEDELPARGNLVVYRKMPVFDRAVPPERQPRRRRPDNSVETDPEGDERPSID